eukprot:800318-Rhodomonas_salina.4
MLIIEHAASTWVHPIRAATNIQRATDDRGSEQDQERAMEALMKGDDEWDRRIALMKGEAHLDQKGSSENDL